MQRIAFLPIVFVLGCLAVASVSSLPVSAASLDAHGLRPSDASVLTPASSPPFFPNIPVTDGSSPYLWQVEPTMVINGSGTIFVGWKETDSPTAAGRRVGFSYSEDGGATWAPNVLMNQSHPNQGLSNSDPWMALSPDDRVYYAYLEYDGISGLNVANTTNGKDWGTVHYVQGTGGLVDKESIVVDPLGRLYAAWDEGNILAVTWSDNGGSSWKTPFVDPSDSPGSVLGTVIGTAANGTVYLTWWDFFSDNLLFDWSADRGQTWHTDRRVNDVPGSAPGFGWQIALPAMNVDQSSGAIYIAWPDNRNGNQDIYMSRSTDGGITWSPNTRINDVGTSTQYMVDLAVDSTGKVHAAWEDKRNGAWNIYYANSTNGGQTWNANVRVSSEDTPGTYDRPGDYFAIEAGPNDAIYTVWTDGRGANFDIYFARNPGFPAATVTVATNPAGLQVTVDGRTSASPVQNVWVLGSVHNISVPSPQPLGETARYVWSAWSDGGPIAHDIVASGDMTVTAIFRKQFRATFAVNPSGPSILVDSASYVGPTTLWWDLGSTHWLDAPSPQVVAPDTRFVWLAWSDGGAQAHAVTANSAYDAVVNFQQEHTLRVDTSPSSLMFLLNGVPYTSPATFWLPLGSRHTIGVETSQSGPPGVRYRFFEWSDGGASSHAIAFNGAMSLTARFQSEYYLTVVSQVAGHTGSGWYLEGSTAFATVSNVTSDIAPGERLAFTQWGGDTSGTETTSNPILMDGPKTAIAIYGTQYYLEVRSAYGKTSGSGWYAAGAVARATIPSIEVTAGLGTRQFFSGWTANATGSGASSDPIVMDRPKVATASWKLQYYLSIATAYGVALTQGWYDAGATTAARLDAAAIPLGPGARAVFSGWFGEATGTDANGSTLITMDGAKTVLAAWRVEYELRVETPYGTASGSGWYTAGSFAIAALNSRVISTGPGERAVFGRWGGDATGLTAVLSDPIRMEGARTATALWEIQYLVRVESDFGIVEGGGWYAKGALATLRAPREATSGGQTFAFAGWTGDVVSPEVVVTFPVDGPKVVRATFTATGPFGAPAFAPAVLFIIVAATGAALFLWWRRRRSRD